MHDSTLTLPNGRTIAYTDVGATDAGHPTAIYFHGAPTSRLDTVLFDEELASRGVRVLCADRPGYGGSSPQPGRTMGDHVADVVALADHLGIHRFAVAGLSSGGPYAVAGAALAPSRVSSAVVVAGCTDFGWRRAWDGFEPNEADVMRQPNEDAAVAWCKERLGADGSGFFAIPLPEAETAAMGETGEDFGEAFVATVAAAFVQGVEGYARDVWLQGRPWAFDPGAVIAPLHVFHGDGDQLVPVAHAVHTAALVPGADCTIWPGVTHMGAVMKMPDIIATSLGC